MDIARVITLDNPTRALQFVDELEGKCGPLGGATGIVTARADLGHNIRMLAHRSFLVSCREVSKGLRIERILHGARDIAGEDFETDVLPWG